MADRVKVSSLLIEPEYTASNSKTKVSSLLIEPEYTASNSKTKVSSLLIEPEYTISDPKTKVSFLAIEIEYILGTEPEPDTIPIFPDVPSQYSLTKSYAYNTLVIPYGGKNEQRLSKQANPLTEITLNFEVVISIDAERILNFFNDRKGREELFYLNAPGVATFDVWQPNTYYSVGQIVRPSDSKEYAFKCVIPGTSGSTEPVWNKRHKAYTWDNHTSAIMWIENSYLVRFKEDAINEEYFTYNLYKYGKIQFDEIIPT